MQLSTKRTVDSKNANSSNIGSNFKKKSYNCNYCHYKGHKAADCWKRKAEVGEKKKESSFLAKEEVFLADVVDPLDCNMNSSKILDLESSKKSKNNDKASVAAVFNVETAKTSEWCIDSGETSHMCCSKGKFCGITPAPNQKVRLATGETAKIEGKGIVRIEVPTLKGNKKLRLENALCVPELRTNL